jgi:hypothetical protein
MVLYGQQRLLGVLMLLNMQKILLLAVIIGVSSLRAEEYDPRKFTVARKTITEVTSAETQKNNSRISRNLIPQGLPNGGVLDPVETAGKVIAVAKDMVALGESVYQLVIKGKPTTSTTYAPISVVPRMGSAIVDVMELEGWSVPVTRSYEVKYYNYYNVAVVTFKYSVIYSYKGSYNGSGAYLTAVQVIPDHVRTLFGFDFTATMKLGGVQNQGNSANKVAGVTILMEHTVSSVLVNENTTDKFFITGIGQFKKY